MAWVYRFCFPDGSYYFGATTLKCRKINSHHSSLAKSGSNRKVHMAIREFNFSHTLEIVCEGTARYCRLIRSKCIKAFKDNHNRIVKSPWNKGLTGWNNGLKHTAEAKIKMSKSHLKRHVELRSDPNFKKSVPWMLGRKHSEETKNKMSLGHIGFKHSEETKNKMRLVKLSAKAKKI